MKILQVIHGYPLRYNAGSEVYTQTLCGSLADHHEISVFTREEDPFLPDYHMRTERDLCDHRVKLYLVNNPRNLVRYQVSGIDRRFNEVLDRIEPDIVHVQHLNHLSTSLPELAAKREIPVIYTLHDYWVMCPRGQFMQMFPENPNEIWTACDGQENRKCAERCFARFYGGDGKRDVDHWTDWVHHRMGHLREMTQYIDCLIAPSRYLLQRYRDEFNLASPKIHYLDYGFELSRLNKRKRIQTEPFTFGYIGTHIPAKGIHDLIRAFQIVEGNPLLRIWGRPNGFYTDSLKEMVGCLPESVSSRVEWIPEYRNQDISRDVFDRVDAIVVPSIWVENSPLVIHEAQQARIPVITADVGGMAEYVHHEVNGLLFRHRLFESLADQMQRFTDNPDYARILGQKGYLYSKNGNIPSIEDHTIEIEEIYRQAINNRETSRVSKMPGPWRLTLDTNPDTCNLRCIMCEEHSPYSELQTARRKEGRARREMPLSLIRKAVSEAAVSGQLRELIPSTMGEPLLFEHFDEILNLCEEYGVKLNLTTNGTFPRLGATEWAKRIVPLASDVKISWNGATKETQETIMLGSNWQKVLDNVRKFIAVRDEFAALGRPTCRVTFQLTFLETNIEELAEIVRLAIELGVDRVKGHHLWAHFEEIKDLSMRRDSNSIERWNKAVESAHNTAQQHRLPNGDHIKLENIFPLDKDTRETLIRESYCPFLGREAWVSAEGRFNPCCAPDAQRLNLGEFGNLNDSEFNAIWNGEAYDSLMATYRNHSLCLSCNMRKPTYPA